MALLTITSTGTESGSVDKEQAFADGEDCSIRIANDAKENGYEQKPGHMTWLNSARIDIDTADDAVRLLVSVADPRGAFCITFRRLDDGRLILHVPYPGDATAHMPLRGIGPGTYEVGYYDADAENGFGKVADFSDSESEEIDEEG